MARNIKTGAQVQAKDKLRNAIDSGFIGEVESLRLYDGTLIDLFGEGSQVATFYGGAEMTLPAKSFYEVAS